MGTLKVYGTRVRIREDAGVKSLSGLIVPDMATANENTGLQKHVKTGMVDGIGQKCEFAKEGMRVVYGRDDITDITTPDSQKFSILREKTILFSFTEAGIDRVNNDRVIIKPEPKERLTEGGLIIPDSVAHRPTMGEVKFVGSDCKWVKPGCKVLFGNAAGTELNFKGEDFVIVREADIIGEL